MDPAQVFLTTYWVRELQIERVPPPRPTPATCSSTDAIRGPARLQDATPRAHSVDLRPPHGEAPTARGCRAVRGDEDRPP